MKKIKEKKAWLRIVEAIIAILIVLSTVLIVMSKNRPLNPVSAEEIYNEQRQIIDLIIKDDSLRESVISNDYDSINNFILKVIPLNWDFSICICEINQVCSATTPNNKDLYSSEAIVTSTLNEYNPKKIRFFVWIK